MLPGGALGSMAVPIVSIGLARLGVDHRDGVAVGVGHVEDLPALRQEHLVGMLLGRPGADDLERGRVDDGDLGLAPEADVEPPARLVERQAVGIGVGPEGDLALEGPRLGVEPRQRVAEGGGDVERLAVLRDRQAGRRPLVLLGRLVLARVPRRQECLAVGIFEHGLVREQAVGVVEPVDQVVEPAADEELLAVGRPGQPGERPRERDPADHPAAAAPSTVTTSCSP